jgi:hypothetical protein
MKRSALVLAVSLAGCSAIQERVALDSEESLTAAGFRREPLNAVTAAVGCLEARGP